MENRNLGQMLRTQEHQSFPGTGRNFEQMPYTHGAQSLPDAGQNFEHMPCTHTDQTFPNADNNSGKCLMHSQIITILMHQQTTWDESRLSNQQQRKTNS